MGWRGNLQTSTRPLNKTCNACQTTVVGLMIATSTTVGRAQTKHNYDLGRILTYDLVYVDIGVIF
jgi:hypothetical protein